MAVAEVPSVLCLTYDSWPKERGALEMQFRLVYQGPLPAASNGKTRAAEKHRIRTALDPQLRELWRTNPFLSAYLDPGNGSEAYINKVGNKFERHGYRYVPLIADHFGAGEPRSLGCALDILFLRYDQPPGEILRGGGDIDNRIKTLFDALQIPESGEGVDPPSGDDNFMFCLMQDDNLVTEVKITTDRLLEKRGSSKPAMDVHLVVHVKTLVLGSSGFTAFAT